MRRLAVYSYPRGGFWAKTQKLTKMAQIVGILIQFGSHKERYIIYDRKHIKQLPLPVILALSKILMITLETSPFSTTKFQSLALLIFPSILNLLLS